MHFHAIRGFDMSVCQLPRVAIVSMAMILLAVIGGCASYVTPSGRADLASISSVSMQESFAAKPAAVFPAHIAAVRVQAPRYRSYYTEQHGGVYGHGRYSVVTSRDAGEEEAISRLSALSQVGGLVNVSTLLLPQKLETERELREAAARLKADMVLIYTFDTAFYNSDLSKALNTVTLGLSPTRTVHVRVNASALLVDTRTGFIYTALEAHEQRSLLSNVWESKQTADRGRRDAESAAFQSLIAEFEKQWPRVVERAKEGA